VVLAILTFGVDLSCSRQALPVRATRLIILFVSYELTAGHLCDAENL
jgi:hypothetical protein